MISKSSLGLHVGYMCSAVARQSTLAVPTNLGYLAILNSDLQFLQTFVHVFNNENILRLTNPNLPEQIHILLRGFADFGVDIRAWGSYRFGHGFFRMLLDYDALEAAAGRPLNPPMAKRVFIVPSVEPRVVDGHMASVLQPGVNLTQVPTDYFLPGIVK